MLHLFEFAVLVARVTVLAIVLLAPGSLIFLAGVWIVAEVTVQLNKFRGGGKGK